MACCSSGTYMMASLACKAMKEPELLANDQFQSVQSSCLVQDVQRNNCCSSCTNMWDLLASLIVGMMEPLTNDQNQSVWH